MIFYSGGGDGSCFGCQYHGIMIFTFDLSIRFYFILFTTNKWIKIEIKKNRKPRDKKLKSLFMCFAHEMWRTSPPPPRIPSFPSVIYFMFHSFSILVSSFFAESKSRERLQWKQFEILWLCVWASREKEAINWLAVCAKTSEFNA